MADATSIFTLITGYPPYDYQRVLAERKRPPGVVEVPTGSGKTLAVLLPWLLDERGPRRLVYALPMRSLVEQTAEVVHAALAATGRDDVDAHVLMGGEEMREWQRAPARRAVLVGTIDMLLSRALGRGYGESRYAWPVSFGLLNSDCRWIFDEVQLMGPARTTSAQLAGLRALLGTARPCETVWMSATIDHAALATVDHPRADDVVRLSAADRAGPLARRLNARKELVRLDLGGIEPKDTERLVPEAVLDRHRPATRTSGAQPRRRRAAAPRKPRQEGLGARDPSERGSAALALPAGRPGGADAASAGCARSRRRDNRRLHPGDRSGS